jgi:hypothetical protein
MARFGAPGFPALPRQLATRPDTALRRFLVLQAGGAMPAYTSDSCQASPNHPAFDLNFNVRSLHLRGQLLYCLGQGKYA